MTWQGRSSPNSQVFLPLWGIAELGLWPQVVKSALAVDRYRCHKIICYFSYRELGSRKLTYEYEASKESHQKADGVLCPSIPFWACLSTNLGIQQLLVQSRLLRGHPLSSPVSSISNPLLVFEYNFCLVLG